MNLDLGKRSAERCAEDLRCAKVGDLDAALAVGRENPSTRRFRRHTQCRAHALRTPHRRPQPAPRIVQRLRTWSHSKHRFESSFQASLLAKILIFAERCSSKFLGHKHAV